MSSSSLSTKDLAKAALERSRRWLQGAKRALEDKRWDDVVYASQMAVEQCSKAVLIAFGIDYPKEHDVSPVFRKLAEKKLPQWFLSMLEELSENISELAKLRGLAGYGFEVGVGAEYFRDYAPEALSKASKQVDACAKLLKELFGV